MLSSADGWTSAILAGKRDSRRHFITSFSKKFVVAGTTTVRGLIILRPGEGLDSFNKSHRANISDNKEDNDALRGVYVFRENEKKLVSWISSSNLKVCNETEALSENCTTHTLLITKINVEHNSVIVTNAEATEEHSLLSRSQGELRTQVTCQKTIKPISTCEASSTLPASLVCESFFWSCQESDLKKKSTAGEDEAGIYNNKKILIMSLITLQQNHSSVHRVPAMTVKGKRLPKDEKKLLT